MAIFSYIRARSQGKSTNGIPFRSIYLMPAETSALRVISSTNIW